MSVYFIRIGKSTVKYIDICDFPIDSPPRSCYK